MMSTSQPSLCSIATTNVLSRAIVAGALATTVHASAEPTRAALAARIERVENGLTAGLQIAGEEVPRFNVKERLAELGIPGLSVAVVADGKLDWARGYGLADVTSGRKVNANTLFLAGSISKPLAAIRTHQLAEAGKVRLDGNVNDYLTSWRLPDNKHTVVEKVTLRRILNHTAGLTVWGFPGYDKGDTIPTVPEVLDGKGNTDPVRVYKVPGESWQYSGGGYTVMQLLITDVERRSFPDIMRDNVLTPLGMAASTFKTPCLRSTTPSRRPAIAGAATRWKASGPSTPRWQQRGFGQRRAN